MEVRGGLGGAGNDEKKAKKMRKRKQKKAKQRYKKQKKANGRRMQSRATESKRQGNNREAMGSEERVFSGEPFLRKKGFLLSVYSQNEIVKSNNNDEKIYKIQNTIYNE